MKKENLIGRRFCRLVVVDEANPPHHIKYKKRYVRCNCDCGTTDVIVSVRALKQGSTKSCGCLCREVNRQLHTKENVIDIEHFEHGVINTKNGDYLFDIDDLSIVQQCCWSVNHEGYLYNLNYFGKIVFLHNLIIPSQKGMVVDHISGDVKDNRKANLRICTRSQNSQNRKISSNDTSGVTRVSFDKCLNKWRARIVISGKSISLGAFYDLDKAIEARKNAETKYFGEFQIKDGNV